MIWFFRKWFWITLAWFKAAVNKPQNIPLPVHSGGLIRPVPLGESIAGLEQIKNILACPLAQIPADERSVIRTKFHELQVWLFSAFSPMQSGLPSISTDPDVALRGAFTWLHRRKYGQPVLPAEYLGSPDLGALAVRGPYACYTRKRSDGRFEWDLLSLAEFEHHRGLLRLGVKVLFELEPAQRTLRAVCIESVLGSSTPGDNGWELAKKLALCSATTHVSLVRHFNWVHLACGAQLATATRNRLPSEHPLLRLLWPYIYCTEQGNDMVSRTQMLPKGDFEATFSFNFDGLCQLFDATWKDCHFGINDPVQDAQTRQVLGQGFDTPTEDNLAALYEVMLEHARDYLSLYYPHAAQGTGVEGLRDDGALLAWLDELNTLLPQGVGVTRSNVNFDRLARLVASCIYLASAQHEILGSFLWNYQSWTHRQPVRVYASGQPEPMDVYQRLINANFNLNVTRRALIHDFSYLALDELGLAAMRRFNQQLLALQTDMAREPWAVWKLYPRDLKVNINA
jgi:arachidonate 15-lipoxygenase